MQDKLSAEQKHVRQGMQDRMDSSIDTGYDGYELEGQMRCRIGGMQDKMFTGQKGRRT